MPAAIARTIGIALAVGADPEQRLVERHDQVGLELAARTCFSAWLSGSESLAGPDHVALPFLLRRPAIGEVAVEVDPVRVGPPVGVGAVGVGGANQIEVDIGRELAVAQVTVTRSPARSSPWMLPMMTTFVRAPG